MTQEFSDTISLIVEIAELEVVCQQIPRIELASAVHDYIEFWHNMRRRHSSLGMLTASEIETAWSAAHDNDVAHTVLAQTAPTGLVNEESAAGLAGTSEGNVPIDHQHLLLNSNHAD